MNALRSEGDGIRDNDTDLTGTVRRAERDECLVRRWNRATTASVRSRNSTLGDGALDTLEDAKPEWYKRATVPKTQ